MSRERKAVEAPKAFAGEEATIAESKQPWWKEHPSSATVLLVAALTSALYFFGSRRLDTLATEFGLAGPPRSMGLQEVMVAGVDVFQLPVMLILLFAWSVFYVILKFAIWLHEYVVEKQNSLTQYVNAQQETAMSLRERDHSTITAEEIIELERTLDALVARVRRMQVLSKASRYATKLGSLSKYIIGSVAVSLIMLSGMITGKLDAWAIRFQVADECRNCFQYVSPRGTIVALPIFQADDKIIAYRLRGTIVIPLTEDLVIRKYSPTTKKAGPKGGTKNPTA